jgi:hypothetical protein
MKIAFPYGGENLRCLTVDVEFESKPRPSSCFSKHFNCHPLMLLYVLSLQTGTTQLVRLLLLLPGFFFSDFNGKRIFPTDFSKNPKKSNLIKIIPVVGELFHSDEQTGRYDEANSGFLQFCEIA